MRERLYYAVLWVVAVIAMSIPWATTYGKTLTGWNFVVPFSAPYLIGLLLGLIVLLTKASPLWLSIAAGVLMLVGVSISACTVGVMIGLPILFGATVSLEAGIDFAFVWSIIYLVAGSVLGKRMRA